MLARLGGEYGLSTHTLKCYKAILAHFWYVKLGQWVGVQMPTNANFKLFIFFDYQSSFLCMLSVFCMQKERLKITK